MKLLVDMNLSPRWISFLSDAGWEATHWSKVGKADASDSEIMTFAAGNDYVVLTNDLDFAAILAASRDKKPSVAQIRAGPQPKCDRRTNGCRAPARATGIRSRSAIDH